MFNRYRYTTGVKLYNGHVGCCENMGTLAYTHVVDGYHIVDGNKEIAFTEDRDVAELIVRALNSFGERP